jgi:hypothetical protein
MAGTADASPEASEQIIALATAQLNTEKAGGTAPS